MDHLFVTGPFRCGTTLVDKLLHAHPSLSVSSQPCPMLWSSVKAAFLAAIGKQSAYPLGHLFGDDADDRQEFLEYLGTDSAVSAAVTAQVSQAINSTANDNVCTAARAVQESIGRPFIDAARRVWYQLAAANGDVSLSGSKEIVCDEYIPYLLRSSVRCICVVRDPRDMLTSMTCGRAEQFIGKVRPTLFPLLVWRKTIAFILEHQGMPGFHWLRYEDLVERPVEILNNVFRFLGVDPCADRIVGWNVIDQQGQNWAGNSAFGDLQGISTAPAGRFVQSLNETTIRYVETVCGPEMAVMGYSDAWSGDAAPIRNFKEPIPVTHRALPNDYSTRCEQVDAELHRLELLKGSDRPSVADQQRWFIFQAAYNALRSAPRS